MDKNSVGNVRDNQNYVWAFFSWNNEQNKHMKHILRDGNKYVVITMSADTISQLVY